jgi:hypothetical protein
VAAGGEDEDEQDRDDEGGEDDAEDDEDNEDGPAGGAHADVAAFRMPTKWPVGSTKERKDIEKFWGQLKLLRSQRSRARGARYRAKREGLDEQIKSVLLEAEHLWRRLSST